MWNLIKLLGNTRIASAIRKNHGIKSLVKLFYKIIMLPFSKSGVMVNIGGISKCRLDYVFALSRYESFGDRHNSGFKKWLESCKKSRVVFDVGAHIGLYSVPASGVIPEGGIIYAFEPSIANRGYFKKHIEYNHVSNIVLLPYIVGDEASKEQVFYESGVVDPANSLNPKKNLKRYSKVLREQITLDGFSEEHKLQPDLIKIDVEGAEYNVLKGAAGMLKKCLPLIFLSAHPGQLPLFGASVSKLKDFITQLGYCIRDDDGAEVADIKFGEYLLLPQRRQGI